MIKLIKRYDWSFFKRALKIITPLVMAQVIVVAISFIDGIMVNGYNNVEAASLNFDKVDYKAVGAANELWFAFQAFYSALSVIFSILYAQFANNKKVFVDTAKVNFWASTIISIAVSSIMFFAAEPIVHLFFLGKTHPDVSMIKNIGVHYLKIMALGNLFISLCWAMLNPLTIKGKTKYAFYLSVISLLLNIILDYILIYVCNMGAEGSAWATVVAYAAEFVITIFIVIKHKDWFTGFWNLFIINKSIVKELMKRSFILITFVAMQMGFASATIIYSNLYGSQVIAPMSVGYIVSSIIFTVFAGINRSVKYFIGPLLGESKFNEARKVSKKLLFPNIFLAMIFSILALISASFFPQLMLTTKSDIKLAQRMIYIYASFLIFYVMQSYFSAIIETSGGQIMPNLFNYLLQAWASLPMIVIFSDLGVDFSFTYNFLMAQTVYVVASFVLYVDYRRFKWLKRIEL